jgi:hypothetical protein
MIAALSGKNITLIGSFERLNLTTLAPALTACGASLIPLHPRRTDLIVCGEGDDDLRAAAQVDGIPTRDEAWLLDVLADKPHEPPPILDGPLGDYIARLDAYAAALRTIPGLKVGYTRNCGASPALLARLARAHGLDSFEPAICNLYQQADGLCIFWSNTSRPGHAASWPADMLRRFDALAAASPHTPHRLPSPADLEAFPLHLGGLLYLLPASLSLNIKNLYHSFDDGFEDVEPRVAYGHTWRGATLEQSLRALDMSSPYYPVTLLISPPTASPLVIVGDDSGANWTDSRHASFEDYMEGLLNQHFTLAAREALICAASRTAPRTFTRPAPVLLSSLL